MSRPLKKSIKNNGIIKVSKKVKKIRDSIKSNDIIKVNKKVKKIRDNSGRVLLNNFLLALL